ncbi:MAG: EAL domain-containing protein [Azospirillum sp.]|nr:EAL domain-containing protein [Azospirillum sp.]
MTPSRVLIIDGDQAVGSYIAAIAAKSGFAAEAVTSAEEFRQRIATLRPSHVVLDLRLVATQGDELLRELAANHQAVRLMVMTDNDGSVGPASRLVEFSNGPKIAATLRKPLSAADLSAVFEDTADAVGAIDEAALQQAVDNRQFHLVFQPKIDLTHGHTVGFEALLRWHHPRRGIILPGEFLPLAETLAVMDELTTIVIDRALDQLRRWSDQGLETTLAVNVSAVNLKSFRFADRVYQSCLKAGIAPDRLIIELTETAAMADPVRAMDIMTRLRLKGFRLSIDDFGTGYSSLVQLQRLPFSELKIDRALIIDCDRSRQSRIIVKAIIDLARNLGLSTIAEGIETAETLNVVRELGCQSAQGYHFARPLDAVQAETWLKTHSRAAAADSCTWISSNSQSLAGKT